MFKVVTISVVGAAAALLFSVLFFTGSSEPANPVADPVPAGQNSEAETAGSSFAFDDSQEIDSAPSPQIARKPDERASATLQDPPSKAGEAKLAAQEKAQEKAFDNIENAVITYSPEAVNSIVPMLSSADPEIRDAAIEGLVQLGEKRGADALRRAARTAKTPQEKARMLKAADFIELPPVQLEWVQPTISTQVDR